MSLLLIMFNHYYIILRACVWVGLYTFPWSEALTGQLSLVIAPEAALLIYNYQYIPVPHVAV